MIIIYYNIYIYEGKEHIQTLVLQSITHGSWDVGRAGWCFGVFHVASKVRRLLKNGEIPAFFIGDSWSPVDANPRFDGLLASNISTSTLLFFNISMENGP